MRRAGSFKLGSWLFKSRNTEGSIKLKRSQVSNKSRTEALETVGMASPRLSIVTSGPELETLDYSNYASP